MNKIVALTLTASIALASLTGCAAKDAQQKMRSKRGQMFLVFQIQRRTITEIIMPGRDTAEEIKASFPDTFTDNSRFNINRWNPEYIVGSNAELTVSDSSDDYKTEDEPNLQDVVPSLYIFNKLGTLVPIADTQFDFLGITEDASFDDVLKVMDNYGKPYYGHNYTKEREDQAGSGSGILSYLTTDGYKIEFYFDGYGKYMNSVHIAYVPGELSYREGMARLHSNN